MKGSVKNYYNTWPLIFPMIVNWPPLITSTFPKAMLHYSGITSSVWIKKMIGVVPRTPRLNFWLSNEFLVGCSKLPQSETTTVSVTNLRHFTLKASMTSVHGEANAHSPDWLMDIFVNEQAPPDVCSQQGQWEQQCRRILANTVFMTNLVNVVNLWTINHKYLAIYQLCLFEQTEELKSAFLVVDLVHRTTRALFHPVQCMF